MYDQLTSTTLNLKWTAPKKPNGVITEYKVFYENSTNNFTVTSNQTVVTLKNLKKFGEYKAFVTAATKHGDGNQKSAKLTFQTLEDGM